MHFLDPTKDCPVCGEIPLVKESIDGRHAVLCTNSGCPENPQTFLYTDMEEARRVWNAYVDRCEC